MHQKDGVSTNKKQLQNDGAELVPNESCRHCGVRFDHCYRSGKVDPNCWIV